MTIEWSPRGLKVAYNNYPEKRLKNREGKAKCLTCGESLGEGKLLTVISQALLHHSQNENTHAVEITEYSCGSTVLA